MLDMFSFILYIFLGLITNTYFVNMYKRRAVKDKWEVEKDYNADEKSDDLFLYGFRTLMIVLFHPIILPVIAITDLSFVITKYLNKLIRDAKNMDKILDKRK